MSRRLLLVHAHPDDETLTTGATMAAAVADGVEVVLVTCTLGERGEVLGPLRGRLEGDGPALGRHRAGELAAATAALGVRDHRLLAGGRWSDSGMVWVAPGLAGPAPDASAAAFARAELDEPARALADVLVEVRPHVVVTYDPGGGYRHPDHVMAHRVTVRAVELAAAAGWDVPRLLWVQVPRTAAEAERRQVRAAAAAGLLPAPLRPPPDDAGWPPAVVDDAAVVAAVEAPGRLPAKVAALRAHATQVQVHEPWYALSNHEARVLSARECFVLGRGVPFPGPRPAPDLFAGLDLR